MAKLWAKGYELNEKLERFTVGKDYQLDVQLIEADCIGSAAHASMLAHIGLLKKEEFLQLKSGLLEIIHLARQGSFAIPRELEDGHTAIESYLTEKVGEVGKKIHTGRSRNDQVLTSTRLWLRGGVVTLLEAGLDLVDSLTTFAASHKQTAMPGRTHLQMAMPSTFALWAGAWAEELVDSLSLGAHLLDIINRSPLGAAASYGSPLPVDRAYSAEAMGFGGVQNNVLYVNNSRGKFEAMALDIGEYLMSTLSKMAQDLMLFSLPEFGYVTLPKELCSGSSIMPQKQNPDGLELIRGKAATLSGKVISIKSIIRALPSGYNRDFQETKEPLLTGLPLVIDSLAIMQLTIESLVVDKEKLIESCTPELFATDQVFAMVEEGMSFRDAYKEVGTHRDTFTTMDTQEVIRNRQSLGEAGNLGLDHITTQTTSLRKRVARVHKQSTTAMKTLMGEVVYPFPLY